MTLSKTALTLILSILTVCLLAGSSQAKQRYWSDIKAPFTSMEVYTDDSAVIKVDLPENFIKNTDHVTLVMTLMSASRDITLKEGSFVIFFFKQIVNKKLYTVPITKYPAIQTIEIQIKTKHLWPGTNTLKVSCDLKPGWESLGTSSIAMVIKEMYFKDVP